MARKKTTRGVAATSKAPEPDDVFDVSRVRQLVELMKEHDLSEVDLRHLRHHGQQYARDQVSVGHPPRPRG